MNAVRHGVVRVNFFCQSALKQLESVLFRAAKSVSRTLRWALGDFQKVFAPQTRGETARKGTGLIREMGVEIDLRRDRAAIYYATATRRARLRA